ncbi:uncharacterized protein N7511_004782 [Penicillium nucicola]|uniref:uncharacterized protein n=1 Tax=Penicillium nucicola TaxID=1850975 RepID=UPI0025458C25|nr:uncharacterized protein N7511_004782 [Penicillium nucicola]KAJ5767166.1 hypothetical protein N7511_004782 [Penicillium nucicola]
MQSICLLLGLAALISATPLGQQLVLGETEPAGQVLASRKPLSGRFLHITDFHPDRLYKPGTSIDRSCHHGDGPSGYFGAEGTECDSPLSLVNETFRWIEDNLKDDIDFVIWTGDSARHDNDEKLPRSAEEIVQLNRFLTQKWVDLFSQEQDKDTAGAVSKLSVPVIPTFGNNDIMPHNIFNEGPNKWTKRFADVWKEFIPEDQRHTFVEGGWFTAEVVPGRLAVISLNTMYFFESNSAVDGCKAKSEPGYEHMEWLRVQLKILRSRNMKAILMGHVPPARSSEKKNWDETCWQKYTLWMHQYRDVVVGSLYGHMNIDHFMLQDSNKVKIADADGKVSVRSKSNYLESLRDQWSSLPSPPTNAFEELEEIMSDNDDSDVTVAKKNKKHNKKDKKKRKFLEKIGGPWAERYSVSLVAPSLVPNYFPSLRVIEYNITDLDNVALGVDLTSYETQSISDDVDDTAHETIEHETFESNPSTTDPEIQKKKKKDKKKKPNFKVPEPPSSTAPPGPAYSNQALSWLSYTQYFANLTQINHEIATGQQGDDPRINFEVEYRTDDDVYQMKDLTVRSYFQLAARIAEEDQADADSHSGSHSLTTDWSATNKKKPINTAWRTFLTRAFVGYEDIDDLLD